MQKLYAGFAGFLLALTAIFGIFAWAQKTEEPAENGGLTLANLGVAAEQRARIKALWKLKRQKHVQAIENLRSLNRLAKDAIVSDDEIKKTLKRFRQQLLQQEQKIRTTEEELIADLSPRAQLHLTILGVLENGLVPRRFSATQQKSERNNRNESGRRENEKSILQQKRSGGKKMVEDIGLEPMTSCMPCKRSPN